MPDSRRERAARTRTSRPKQTASADLGILTQLAGFVVYTIKVYQHIVHALCQPEPNPLS